MSMSIEMSQVGANLQENFIGRYLSTQDCGSPWSRLTTNLGN